MFRKVYILIVSVLFCTMSYGQMFYKNVVETKEGIEIKYKVKHTKLFNKNSPVMLCLKLTNTNEFDIDLMFEVQYSTGFTTKYKSGDLEICIPQKKARKGKARGLAFELNTDNANVFSSDDADWEFSKFEVNKIEKCNRNNK